MPCYYIILIVPAAIVTLTASGVVRDLGREQDGRYITMLIVGLGFPGWVLLMHTGVYFLLAAIGIEGYSKTIHLSDLTAPFHIALTAGLSGMLASSVFAWGLRSWMVLVSLGSVSAASALLCLLSPEAATIPPGLIAGMVLWVGMSVAILRLWSATQQAAMRKAGTAGPARSAESRDELPTM